MRTVKMMFCEVWFKKTSGVFSLEKDFKEQIFGKVSHRREVDWVKVTPVEQKWD